MHRLEDIRELQEVQANHGRCQYRQLRRKDSDQGVLIDGRYIESAHLELETG
jgi:hypothetical protein